MRQAQVGLCGILLSLVLSLPATQEFLMVILWSRASGGAYLGPVVQLLALYELRFIFVLWAEGALGSLNLPLKGYRSSRAKRVGHASRGVS